MDLTTNSSDSMMKIEDAKTLEVLKKLSDFNQTVINNDIKHLTNKKSKIEKKDFEQLLNAKEKRLFRHIDNLVHGNVKNFYKRYKINLLDIKYIKQATKILDKHWEYINSSIIQDNTEYMCKVRQLTQVKKSFSHFIDFKENQVKNLKDEVKIERANTKAQKNELEECIYDLEVVENKKLILLEQLTISEGCYMVLTWLSPPEWKMKFNINKLNQDFVMPDYDFNKRIMNEDYMNYAFQKLSEKFSKEYRLEPVLKMYWESEEQFSNKLVMLNMKLRDKLLINTSIDNSIDNSNYILNNKQQYNIEDRSKYENKLKHYTVSNIDSHDRIIKNILTENDTLFNIKLMLVEINAALNKPPKQNLTRPSKVIKSLFYKLNESLNDIDEFQQPLWQKTDEILNLIEESEANKIKKTKLKCSAVKTTQRTADKIFNSPDPNVRKQKVLPNRLMIPKQKLPKKPKKASLNNEQLMYLKCFTYLSPTDITSDDIPLVPEFKTSGEIRYLS